MGVGIPTTPSEIIGNSKVSIVRLGGGKAFDLRFADEDVARFSVCAYGSAFNQSSKADN